MHHLGRGDADRRHKGEVGACDDTLSAQAEHQYTRSLSWKARGAAGPRETGGGRGGMEEEEEKKKRKREKETTGLDPREEVRRRLRRKARRLGKKRNRRSSIQQHIGARVRVRRDGSPGGAFCVVRPEGLEKVSRGIDFHNDPGGATGEFVVLCLWLCVCDCGCLWLCVCDCGCGCALRLRSGREHLAAARG